MLHLQIKHLIMQGNLKQYIEQTFGVQLYKKKTIILKYNLSITII